MREDRAQLLSREATKKASDHILQNVEAISALYEHAELAVTRHQRGIEKIVASLGRPASLYVILVLALVWIALNLAAPLFGGQPIDAPPFAWLQGIVGMGALWMSTVILIAQNRQAKLDDQRAHLDLQVNLLSEKKIAKLIALIEELRRDLPSVKDRYDPEAAAMERPADPQLVAKALEDQPGARR